VCFFDAIKIQIKIFVFITIFDSLGFFLCFSGDSVEPEALNKKALDIVHRVRDKLTGRDFNKEVSSQHQTLVL
jgi:hypothetical protein